MSNDKHIFELGNFGPTTAPLCKICGLSREAVTHLFDAARVEVQELLEAHSEIYNWTHEGEPPATEFTRRGGQHSPLPWRLLVNKHGVYAADNNGLVVDHVFGTSNPQRVVNGKLIVRAVNNADKLADALRGLLEWCNDPEFECCVTQQRATAALADYETSKGGAQ